MTTKPPHNYTRLAMVAAVAALVLSLTAAAAGFPAQQAIVKPVNGGSTSSSSSIANSAQTSAGTSSVFYFRPCNCSVNIRHLLSVYSTLGALQSSSDFVVVARVSSQTTIGVNVSSAIGTPVKGLVPVTIYNITITTVLSETSNLSAGEWQTVAQIGGTFGETTMNVTGYPSLPVGQSYVFFLTHVDPISDYQGTALVTVGGQQGLFYIQEGNVYSLNNMYPQDDSWLPVDVSDVPLAQFISEVQSTSSSTSNVPSTETTLVTSSERPIVPCNCSIDLSWAWPTYSTLGGLASASESVVVANVTSELTVGVNVSAQEGPGVKGLVPVTGYTITVTSVISDPFPGNPGLQTGDKLSLAQIGGTESGMTMSVIGYPSLSIGQSYVLFLTTPGSLLANFYGSINNGFTSITTGGPQGLFYTQGGNVYSLDTLYPQADSWLPVTAHGVPLAQFIAEVQAAATGTTATTYSSSAITTSTAASTNTTSISSGFTNSSSESSFSISTPASSASLYPSYLLVVAAAVGVILLSLGKQRSSARAGRKSRPGS